MSGKKNVIENVILTRRAVMRETLFYNRRLRRVQVGFLPQDGRIRRRVWKIAYVAFSSKTP